MRLPEGSHEKLWRLIISGIQEIIGVDQLDVIMKNPELAHLMSVKQAAPLMSDIGRNDLVYIRNSLQQHYGKVSGLGITCRAGQSLFPHFLREFGDELGMSQNSFKLLPTHTKIFNGLQAFADFFSQSMKSTINISQDQKNWYWEIRDCPWCRETTSDMQVCYFPVGIIQSFTSWASGGRYYSVSEIECHAAGQEICIIAVDKVPLRMH